MLYLVLKCWSRWVFFVYWNVQCLHNLNRKYFKNPREVFHPVYHYVWIFLYAFRFIAWKRIACYFKIGECIYSPKTFPKNMCPVIVLSVEWSITSKSIRIYTKIIVVDIKSIPFGVPLRIRVCTWSTNCIWFDNQDPIDIDINLVVDNTNPVVEFLFCNFGLDISCNFFRKFHSGFFVFFGEN